MIRYSPLFEAIAIRRRGENTLARLNDWRRLHRHAGFLPLAEYEVAVFMQRSMIERANTIIALFPAANDEEHGNTPLAA